MYFADPPCGIVAVRQEIIGNLMKHATHINYKIVIVIVLSFGFIGILRDRSERGNNSGFFYIVSDDWMLAEL